MQEEIAQDPVLAATCWILQLRALTTQQRVAQQKLFGAEELGRELRCVL